MQNPVQFHRPDGAGYEFVAKQVLAIDRLNPSIAARMLGAFRTWQVLETERRSAARKVLQAVVKHENLSRDALRDRNEDARLATRPRSMIALI